MKLKKFVILLASFMIVGGVLSEAKVVRADSQNIVDVRSVGQSNISTFSTNKGDAGITKLEIQNRGRRIWWYAKPYKSGAFSFKGIVTVTDVKGIPAVYYVGDEGTTSVSGYISLRYKARKATMTGVSYGSYGIALTMPFSETYYGG